jgi:hypothetical protein
MTDAEVIRSLTYEQRALMLDVAQVSVTAVVQAFVDVLGAPIEVDIDAVMDAAAERLDNVAAVIGLAEYLDEVQP